MEEPKLLKRTNDMEHSLHAITNSIGLQIWGMNEKMQDEGDNRYNRIDERIADMEKKFSMVDEIGQTKTLQRRTRRPEPW